MPRRSTSKEFVTIDAETDPFQAGRIPQPFIWGCYHGTDRSYYEFSDKGALLGHLAGRNLIVYAHNGGKFDFHYLRDDIDSDKAIMVIAGRLASFKIGECEFRDSINILVNPLRAFAKEQIDYSKLEAAVRHQHMPEIRQYLKSDCVNLWDTIARYFAEYGRGMTAAGSAMRFWKKTYKVPMTPQTAGQSLRYRDYYFGGRVECFATGHKRENFSVVDINSAYPRAMLEKHPIAPDAVMEDHLPPAGQMGRSFVKFAGVADGALPFKEESGKLTFPNDGEVRDYAVSGWELEAALELNRCRILNVKEVRRFTQTVDFADYVQNFWDRRRKAKAIGDKAADVFAKLFLNSLYGKFAADPEKYREYVLASDDTAMRWAGIGYEQRCLWGDRWLYARPLPEEKHHYYNVATAASITGYVRAMLLKGMAKCEGVLYCDTDSIAARDVSRLTLGAELGQWKLELEGDEYAIAAKKTYAFHRRQPVAADGGGVGMADEWKVASKGVRLSPAEIITCASGETVRHVPEVPTYSIFKTGPVFVPRVIKRTDLHS